MGPWLPIKLLILGLLDSVLFMGTMKILESWASMGTHILWTAYSVSDVIYIGSLHICYLLATQPLLRGYLSVPVY